MEEIKRSPTRLVLRTRLADGASVYIKRYLQTNWGRRIASRVHPSKARREYEVTLAALDRDIPAAPALAAAEVWDRGFLVENYIVLEAVEPAVSLGQALGETSPVAGGMTRGELLQVLARFLVSIQQKGFNHDDLRCDHILVRRPADRPPEFVLIDLDGARIHRGPLGFSQIVHNLVQLNRSTWGMAPTPAERLQFLRELIRVHPRLSDCRAPALWRRIAALSAIRRRKGSSGRQWLRRARFELFGQLSGKVQRTLKEDS